jgi:starch synthase
MGIAGRQRAVADFSWDAIAQQTIEVYEDAMRA